MTKLPRFKKEKIQSTLNTKKHLTHFVFFFFLQYYLHLEKDKLDIFKHSNSIIFFFFNYTLLGTCRVKNAKK